MLDKVRNYIFLVPIFLTGHVFFFNSSTNALLNPIDDFNSLDKKLTLIFSGSEKKDGNEVYKLVDQLNRALAELREMIRNRDERIKAPLKWLLSKEGPRYLEVFFDEEKLSEDFQWDSELVAQISKARMQTYNLWKKLKRTYKKNFIWFMCGQGVNTPVTVDPE
uniref:Uncharacterized protein n=1 Tax=Homalodisca liturata TaxID=320908 RepID=A0A1B6HW88_9HEMI